MMGVRTRNTRAQRICFMYVFSIVGVMFCEGRNKDENMAKSLLEVYKDSVSKVLHPSPNTVIHSVLVGPRAHPAAKPTLS